MYWARFLRALTQLGDHAIPAWWEVDAFLKENADELARLTQTEDE